MNVILLSGGSGKRLWPLSNNAYSKQFLQLLKAPDGEYESMVQRVYRQIREAGINDNIVIATSKSQQDLITVQLGSSVEIVIEPERRDTFPAIALSCAYLAFEKRCGLDEVVAVLPVDPYTEISFFKMLSKMEAAVKEQLADLVLMGITPAYPSEKYGYIVPKTGQKDSFARIASFREKPDKQTAKQLIADGALWNGGVFAFKLGYLMNILEQYLNPKCYEDVLNNYVKLNKTSFDYEIVEKADSAAVIHYEGAWKDLGTWQTLTDEMSESTMGFAKAGENCENTYIINSLNIPVVALGMKDTIIATSPDGILVTNNEASTKLKPYVDKLDLRPMYEERRWGSYEVLKSSDSSDEDDDMQTLTKHIHIKSGKNISYQSHKCRDEVWVIIDGRGDLLIDGHVRNVQRGDIAYVLKGQKHAIRAVEDVHIIEVQIGTNLVEEDIERFDWEWE